MPEVVTCSACSRPLRVPDNLLGRLVRCPACGHTFTAEKATPLPPLPQPPAGADAPPLPEASPPLGNQAAPESRPSTDIEPAPVPEISPSTSIEPAPPGISGVKEEDTWEDRPPPPAWEEKPLATEEDRSSEKEERQGLRCPYCAERNRPAARTCRYCGESLEEDQEYDDDDDRPWEREGGIRRDCDPHRGPLVLTLGIISVSLIPIGGFCCQLLLLPSLALGITSWVMGHSDMGRIRQGTMDPQGGGQTRAGMICGIIATAFSALCGLGWGGWLLVNIINHP